MKKFLVYLSGIIWIVTVFYIRGLGWDLTEGQIFAEYWPEYILATIFGLIFIWFGEDIKRENRRKNKK